MEIIKYHYFHLRIIRRRAILNASDQKIDNQYKLLEDKISNIEGMLQGMLNILEKKKDLN